MNRIDLVPTGSLNERLLVEILAAMYKNYLAKKKAAATSEFTRPDVATAEAQSAQTDVQTDSTTSTTAGQNETEELEPRSE